MADLTLLHTAEVHIATFNALRDKIAPDAELSHILCEDWLARARQHGVDDALKEDIRQATRPLKGPILCSCTSLGSFVETLGVVRIDRPMMQAAAEQAKTQGGTIALAYCLTSTAEASMGLLQECAPNARHTQLFMGVAWPLFEAGDYDGFARMIAERIDAAVAERPDIKTVVLAQASMMQAQDHITSDVTVLSSPETALRAGLGMLK